MIAGGQETLYIFKLLVCGLSMLRAVFVDHFVEFQSAPSDLLQTFFLIANLSIHFFYMDPGLIDLLII